MKRQHFLIFALLVVMVLLVVDPVYAGPGGAIAKAITKTFWGKLLMLILVIIFAPLIIYVLIRERIGVFYTKRTLSKIAAVDRRFNWLDLEKDIRNAYSRVHISWDKEDMSAVQEYVSSWYWQNQQLVYLDEWKSRNLHNVCHLKTIGRIKPLYIELSEYDQFEGTRIAFSIFGEIEDYLIDNESRQIVEGSRGYQEVEKVWIFELTDGKWLLDDIRDGSLSLAFAKMKNSIPENLPTLLQQNKVKRKA